MATMIEKQAESARKDLEKLLARKERQEKSLAKKTAVAEKLGCAWTREQWFGGKREEATPEQANAYFDYHFIMKDLEETVHSIEKAQKRFDKLTGKAETVLEAKTAEEQEINRINGIENLLISEEQQKLNALRKEEEYEKWLKQFKADCLKDGIVIEKAYSSYMTGFTKNGKKFFLDGNNGFTNRSRHCYSLRINGNSIFTSGDFVTAYRYLMKH